MRTILKTSAILAALALAAACGSKSDKKSDDAPTPPPAGDQTQPPADQPASATDGAALVTEFCTGCHNSGHQAGGKNLEPTSLDADVAHEAKEEVDRGDMPPSRAQKQPTAEQRAAISAFLASKL
jgi:mono/diheme cytochrome c family protein